MSGTVRQETREFNAIFIHSSVDDAGLSQAEFRVYGHLSRRAGTKKGAYPGIDSIAKICRMNHMTAVRAIKELERRGMIRVTRNNGKNSVYFLTAPSKWACPKVSRTVSSNSTLPCPHLSRTVTI